MGGQHLRTLRTFIVSILCHLWRGYDHSRILTGGQPLGTVEGQGPRLTRTVPQGELWSGHETKHSAYAPADPGEKGGLLTCPAVLIQRRAGTGQAAPTRTNTGGRPTRV